MVKKSKKTKSKHPKNGSEIQAITFNKSVFTLDQAIKWLKDHNKIPIKDVDITKNYYRFRINPIKKNAKFRIIKNFGKGILTIVQF